MRDRGVGAGRGGGFSLVELLVVVAVIAILAALLLPALGRGKAEARRAQCLSQLQQWGTGLQSYAVDNEEEIPRRGQGVRPLTQLDRPEDWFNALAPELGVQGLAITSGTRARMRIRPRVCSFARRRNRRKPVIS